MGHRLWLSFPGFALYFFFLHQILCYLLSLNIIIYNETSILLAYISNCSLNTSLEFFMDVSSLNISDVISSFITLKFFSFSLLSFFLYLHFVVFILSLPIHS